VRHGVAAAARAMPPPWSFDRRPPRAREGGGATRQTSRTTLAAVGMVLALTAGSLAQGASGGGASAARTD